MKKNQRKILSFSTTMRNPNRISKILSILLLYENQILTHSVIMNILKSIIQNRLYYPQAYLRTNGKLNSKFISGVEFKDNELNAIMRNSIQQHKEKGFDIGWESRFDTIFKLMKEFGFCYYWKGQKLLLSQTGKMLIEACYGSKNFLDENMIDDDLISSVFLNALSKYQVGNPFKLNKNKNTPFVLLLKTLKILHNKDNGFTGIHRNEIPVLCCWRDNNENALAAYILNLRDEIFRLTKNKFGYTREFIYEKCLFLLESDNRIRFKENQINMEAVDEYIRKMRITGLISLRGNGRFLDLNTNEQSKIDYICNKKTPEFNNYLDDSQENQFKFYEYMSRIDSFLIEKSKIIQNENIKIKKLRELATIYNRNDIYKELLVFSKSKLNSQDELFKVILEPLRFEFLTSIALCQAFDDLEVVPNYKTDDEGIPISFAKGGMADIIATDKSTQSLVEVSLIRDRTQTTAEMIPIHRHLIDFIQNSDNQKIKFSIFIAPIIHADALQYREFAKFKDKIDIVCCNIDDFIDTLNHSSEIKDFYEDNNE